MSTAGQQEGRAFALLCVEDEPEAVRALTRQAALRRWTVRSACTLAEARALATEGWWDVMLLDLGLPDGDGAQLLELKRARGDRRGVVVLTGNRSEEKRIFELGADDFVLKADHADNEVLWLRLGCVARRTVGQSRGEVVIGALRCNVNTQELHIDSEPLELRRLLRDLLFLLVAHHPAPVSFEQILACCHPGYSDRRLVYRDVNQLNLVVPMRYRPLVTAVSGFGYRFALGPLGPRATDPVCSAGPGGPRACRRSVR